jgi:hypothetical protein
MNAGKSEGFDLLKVDVGSVEQPRRHRYIDLLYRQTRLLDVLYPLRPQSVIYSGVNLTPKRLI